MLHRMSMFPLALTADRLVQYQEQYKSHLLSQLLFLQLLHSLLLLTAYLSPRILLLPSLIGYTQMYLL